MDKGEMEIFEKVWKMIVEFFYKLFRMWDDNKENPEYPNIKDTTVVG